MSVHWPLPRVKFVQSETYVLYIYEFKPQSTRENCATLGQPHRTRGVFCEACSITVCTGFGRLALPVAAGNRYRSTG